MNLRIHATKLSYLLLVFVILLAKPRFTSPSSLAAFRQRLLETKQRLLEAKPKAFSSFNKPFQVDTPAKKEFEVAVESDAEADAPEFEFERYCEDSVVALNLINSLENEIDDEPFMTSGLEKKLALAQSYVTRVETRRIVLIANKLYPRSKNGKPLSEPDSQVPFNDRIQAIIDLKTRLHLAGPSFEFDATTLYLNSLETIERWRAIKSVQLEVVSAQNRSPVSKFEVQHVQAQLDFTVYCEEDLKASEALRKLEADLREGSLQLFDSTFNDRLSTVDALVSKVEGLQILYHDVSKLRDSYMLDALKELLELAEPGIFVPENPKHYLIERSNDLMEAKRNAQQIKDAGNLAIRREVNQAMANFQYAAYHQKTWKAFKAIESLQADIQSGAVVFDSNIFEKRFIAAQELVKNIPGITSEQKQLVKRLIPKKL